MVSLLAESHSEGEKKVLTLKQDHLGSLLGEAGDALLMQAVASLC